MSDFFPTHERRRRSRTPSAAAVHAEPSPSLDPELRRRLESASRACTEPGYLIAITNEIERAAAAARRDKGECKRLAWRLSRFAEVLDALTKQRPRPVIQPLMPGLLDTLEQAHELITSCQRSRWSAGVQFLLTGDDRVTRKFGDMTLAIDRHIPTFTLTILLDNYRHYQEQITSPTA